ncbi:MAG: porin family protein [Prevotella sp.]|jgi:hypothetical protein|nr:porin family protein [Prevotella sp.]
MKVNCFSSISLLLILLAANASISSAQPGFGVRGGIDVASNDILNVGNGLGYQIGPFAEFTVPASGFGMNISVLYGHKDYKAEDKQNDASISDYSYISIPVNIKQKIGIVPVFGVFLTGGVYGNVKLDGGNIKIKDVIDEYKAKDFIFGLGAGAGVNVSNRFDIGVYFRGDLTKNYGDEYMDADVFQNKKNQTWTVAINYYF